MLKIDRLGLLSPLCSTCAAKLCDIHAYHIYATRDPCIVIIYSYPIGYEYMNTKQGLFCHTHKKIYICVKRWSSKMATSVPHSLTFINTKSKQSKLKVQVIDLSKPQHVCLIIYGIIKKGC